MGATDGLKEAVCRTPVPDPGLGRGRAPDHDPSQAAVVTSQRLAAPREKAASDCRDRGVRGGWVGWKCQAESNRSLQAPENKRQAQGCLRRERIPAEGL